MKIQFTDLDPEFPENYLNVEVVEYNHVSSMRERYDLYIQNGYEGLTFVEHVDGDEIRGNDFIEKELRDDS